jgi:hypothetical protein
MKRIVGGQRKTVWVTGALVAVLVVAYAGGLFAQDSREGSNSVTGFTLFEEFRGSSSSKLGQQFTLDTSVGYNFGSHIGIDIGVPLYRFRETDFLGSTDHSWQNRLGDPYADLRLNFDTRAVNYATYLTFAIPVLEAGSFSTGRLGVDWFNHFDHSVSRYTPFVNIGIANGILDTRLLSQPYRSLQDFATQGFLFYAEGGASVRLGRLLNAGASYYQFAPSGQEKIFAQNLLVQPSGSLTVSDITHDHGATAFVRFSPARFLYIQPSYVHNIQLDDNAVTFRVGIDFRSAANRSTRPSN